MLGARGGACSAVRQEGMDAWMERDRAGGNLLYSAGGLIALLMNRGRGGRE